MLRGDVDGEVMKKSSNHDVKSWDAITDGEAAVKAVVKAAMAIR